MHYHKCVAKLDNHHRTGAVCGQVVAVCDGNKCEHDEEDSYCSIHHPDPAHHVEPTPPLKR